LKTGTAFALAASFKMVVKFVQLIVLAKMRAQVVLPTPLGPQNKNACAKWLFLMAFFKVVVICDCPTTLSKVTGLYFLADTTKFSTGAI
jgi:hypothetical protein